MHWPACAYAYADKCIYFKQVHMLTHAAYHINSVSSVTCALQLWSKKERGVRDDIKYTWTNLKIVRLGIPRTHGWVELAPTVPTSSSHRSSTVHKIYKINVESRWGEKKKMCQIYKYIKKSRRKKVFSVAFDLPDGDQTETKLPSLEVPGPICPRQHSSPPLAIFSTTGPLPRFRMRGWIAPLWRIPKKGPQL